jgi:hypothetical protein
MHEIDIYLKFRDIALHARGQSMYLRLGSGVTGGALHAGIASLGARDGVVARNRDQASHAWQLGGFFRKVEDPVGVGRPPRDATRRQAKARPAISCEFGFVLSGFNTANRHLLAPGRERWPLAETSGQNFLQQPYSREAAP